jgi:hypothetical protein
VTEQRLAWIENFYHQVKNGGNDNISFHNLEKIVKLNLHPEVIKFQKTSPEVKVEYLTTWDNLKEDDIVTYANFIYYFTDISSSVENDEDFLRCLQSLGYVIQ